MKLVYVAASSHGNRPLLKDFCLKLAVKNFVYAPTLAFTGLEDRQGLYRVARINELALSFSDIFVFFYEGIKTEWSWEELRDCINRKKPVGIFAFKHDSIFLEFFSVVVFSSIEEVIEWVEGLE